MPYGGIYAKVSAAALKDPINAKLKALEQSSFQGTTLRGLLLEAYAFSKVGQIMLWGAIASFILAALMAILVGLGLLARPAHPSRSRDPQAHSRASDDGQWPLDSAHGYF